MEPGVWRGWWSELGHRGCGSGLRKKVAAAAASEEFKTAMNTGSTSLI